MAHILASKPRYRPRGTVSVYVLGGQLVARSWRRAGPDPKSARQLASRARMACASGFLKHFANIVSRGYRPGAKPNGRAIGGYQMALSRLMRAQTIYSMGSWRIDYSSVQLTQGRPFALRGCTLQRQGGRLVLHWRGAAPSEVQRLRIALYDARRGESRMLGVPLRPGIIRVSTPLPAGWGTRSLHAWLVLEDICGRLLWTSLYVPLLGGGGSTTGVVPPMVPTALGQGSVPPCEPSG